jgi:hypothetical protein
VTFVCEEMRKLVGEGEGWRELMEVGDNEVNAESTSWTESMEVEGCCYFLFFWRWLADDEERMGGRHFLFCF